MKTRYPLNQSPLYCLSNKRRLGELLATSPQYLQALADASSDAYQVFYRKSPTPGKKDRKIEWPKEPLRKVQRRLVHLLARIEPPDYIHSGFKGRSYITNAQRHPCNCRLAKIDIKSFFPNSSYRCVWKCFIETFKCSPDVGALLTKLTTIGGHLPTGGNASTILSFYAYKPMFDEINGLAQATNLVMSCCVDDMTFSGTAATSRFLYEVRKIVIRYGLRTHKAHVFEPFQTKIVTGIALTTKGYRLPNARRKLLHQAFSDYLSFPDGKRKRELGRSLVGRACEAAQVEDRFKHQMRAATNLVFP